MLGMDIIKQYRQRRGLSQAKLGELIGGRTQGTIGHWETGRTKPDAGACVLLEVVSEGELRAAELRPDLFPECFRVALDAPGREQDARAEAS